MSAEQNKAIVRRFFEAVRDGNHAVIDELVSEDYVRHVPNDSEPKRGREQWKRRPDGVPESQPWPIKQIVAGGDLVIVRRVMRGTLSTQRSGGAPADERVGVAHISVERVANGKLVEGLGLHTRTP